MGVKDRLPTTKDEYVSYKTRFNNWGRWGSDDSKGTLNHITNATVVHATQLVKIGLQVSCANPLATPQVIPNKDRNPTPADHKMSVTKTGSADYVGVFYHGFVNTHIDSLCHFFSGDIDDGGRLYNDKDPGLVTDNGARTNSIESWRDGIVTRGVLYNIAEMRGADYVEQNRPVEGWDLEDWATLHGITPLKGDAVLIKSGYSEFWAANPGLNPGFPPNTPGNAPSILEYLFDTDAALLGWDLQEAGHHPYDYASATPIHEVAIPHMGMPILDNANFDRLSKICRDLNQYEFYLSIAPLVINGGTGSPANPIAIF
ncbi:MAG: cyclase family protein [Chloroflexota bacterium]|nr:cyclase family protein [Chloroflexota bacterium]